MKRIETVKESIRLNLLLANRFMDKGNHAMAINRILDARYLLEDLEILIAELLQDNIDE